MKNKTHNRLYKILRSEDYKVLDRTLYIIYFQQSTMDFSNIKSSFRIVPQIFHKLLDNTIKGNGLDSSNDILSTTNQTSYSTTDCEQ